MSYGGGEMSMGAGPARTATTAPVPGADPVLSFSRIGPNAIIQVAVAARELLGEAETRRLFAEAALGPYLDATPANMVDEAEVARLHRTLRRSLDAATARRLLSRAGTLTGDYVLEHRIPRVVRMLLQALPARIAGTLLIGAIGRHAWTFAGSGRFDARPGRPVRLSIAHNPLCRGVRGDAPLCDYYAATFERLFRALVTRRAAAVEITCEACGADACRFEIRW